MRSPRISPIFRDGNRSRSCPSKAARPPTTSIGGRGSRPMSASAVTDLPQPLSPTMARVSPGPIAKATSSTMFARLSCRRRERPWTPRRGCRCGATAGPGAGSVALGKDPPPGPADLRRPGSRPMSASAVTDLPQPLSPTMARVSPGPIEKETSSTMFARLSCRRRERPSTSRRGCRCGATARPGAASVGIGKGPAQGSGGLQQQTLLQREKVPAHRLFGRQRITPFDGVEHLVVLGRIERDALLGAQRLAHVAPSLVLAHVVDDVEEREEEGVARSEEHTSELQSLMRIPYAVFC